VELYQQAADEGTLALHGQTKSRPRYVCSPLGQRTFHKAPFRDHCAFFDPK
jgi:hypothetical protein